MKFSHRFYSTLGFVIPMCIFFGLLYGAVAYSSLYAFLGMALMFLIKVYRLLMTVPPIRAFLGLKVLKGSDAVLRSEKTAHFFSGLTIFYFILISPFVAVVLYGIWALYLSKLF